MFVCLSVCFVVCFVVFYVAPTLIFQLLMVEKNLGCSFVDYFRYKRTSEQNNLFSIGQLMKESNVLGGIRTHSAEGHVTLATRTNDALLCDVRDKCEWLKWQQIYESLMSHVEFLICKFKTLCMTFIFLTWKTSVQRLTYYIQLSTLNLENST